MKFDLIDQIHHLSRELRKPRPLAAASTEVQVQIAITDPDTLLSKATNAAESKRARLANLTPPIVVDAKPADLRKIITDYKLLEWSAEGIADSCGEAILNHEMDAAEIDGMIVAEVSRQAVDAAESQSFTEDEGATIDRRALSDALLCLS